MTNRIDEFRATYKGMEDEQLLDLAAELDQLTDEARAALRAELDRRGLAEDAVQTQGDAPPKAPPTAEQIAQWNLMGERPPSLPESDLVAVFSAQDDSEADQVQESLRAAGIESQSQIVILVPQAQAEQAFEVLSEQLGPDLEDDEGDGEDQLDEEEEEDEKS